jgi:hypothetical protein
MPTLRPIDPAGLLRDRVVLAALPPDKLSAETLTAQGARDVLILSKSGPKSPERLANHVRLRYSQLSDVRKNNCRVAILHGASAYALAEKSKFGRFDDILVPLSSLPAVALGLLRYAWRGGLTLAGATRLPLAGGGKTYLVLHADLKPRDQRRQYGPTGATPLEILRQLSDLDQIVLRWSEAIEAGTHEGDIDLLIAASDLPAMKARFEQVVGTYPLDVYTDDGSAGHAYKSVPYFMPELARRLLESAVTGPSGVRVAAPDWRFLSFCYHLTFHNKSERIAPDTTRIDRDTYQSPHYYDELARLAALAGQATPASYDDIEARLKQAGVFPSLDLIGFYSNRNTFLKKRYFEQTTVSAGLATFFIRDFGQGLSRLDDIRKRIQEHFTILVEGPVTDASRAAILAGVRGGNWTDPQAPGGRAEAIYWFVCWDETPKPPSRRTRRKHPRVDNEHIRLKDLIRDEHGGGGRKVQPVVHSSDNSLEALDHLEHLKLTNHPAVLARIPTREQLAPPTTEDT